MACGQNRENIVCSDARVAPAPFFYRGLFPRRGGPSWPSRLFSRRDVPLERLWSWRRPTGPSLQAEGGSTVKVLPYELTHGIKIMPWLPAWHVLHQGHPILIDRFAQQCLEHFGKAPVNRLTNSLERQVTLGLKALGRPNATLNLSEEVPG